MLQGIAQATDMTSPKKLARLWSRDLETLLSSVRVSLCVCSPYVTSFGVQFLLSHLASTVKDSVRLTLLTDLSPLNVAQGATDPGAIRELAESIPRYESRIFLECTPKCLCRILSPQSSPRAT